MSLYLCFYFERSPGLESGISIRLRDGDGGPAATWIGPLQAAARSWGEGRPDIFLRGDTRTEPRPCTRVSALGDYLFHDGTSNGRRLQRHLESLWRSGDLHAFLLRPGAPAEPQDLVGREEILATVTHALEEGRSLHLRAPRRYGKSSVLKALQQRLAQAERPCLHVDLSGDPSVPRFLSSVVSRALCVPELADRLHRHPLGARWASSGATPAQRRLAARSLEERAERDPLGAAEQLFDALDGTVLLLDEFSIFLRMALERDRPALSRFLGFLRNRRRKGNPPQVFAGSAGLASYLHFHEMGDFLGDLEAIDLPPLALDDGRALAEELMYGARLIPDSAALERLLEAVGSPVPYFVHALVQALADSHPAGGQVHADTVAEAYEERLLGNEGARFFNAFHLRGQAYPPELLRAASRMLGRLAREDQGLPETELRTEFLRAAGDGRRDDFSPLLACLQEDYDLSFEQGCWSIRCKVLRDRWRRAEPWLSAVA